MIRHLSAVAALVLALSIPSGSVLADVGAKPALDDKTLGGVLKQIQRECLRAYPKDMLEVMAGQGAIPIQVDADPPAQMQFLNKELEVEKGLFYPTLLEELLPALRAYLKEGDRFLDLGSGDGRALFLANVLGAHATGIEYDPAVAAVSRRAAKALEGVVVDPERLHIIEGDFFEQPWSGYDVIFYFDLSSSEQDRVRAKLQNELDADTLLVIGHEQAPFLGFKLVAKIGPMRIYKLEQISSAGHPVLSQR